MDDITLIAPYRRLANTAHEVSLQLGIRIDIKLGKLDEGVRLAHQAVREDAGLIISQGATALQIMQENLAVPVVEVIPTGYDLLRAVLEAQVKGKRLGILDHPELIRGCTTLEEILGIEIVKVPLQSFEVIDQGVEILAKQGVDVVIGNICVMPRTLSRGLQAVLVNCCQESMANALHEARRILSASKRGREQMEQIQSIINFIDSGIVAIDNQGRIMAINPMASLILGIDQQDAASESVASIPFGERLLRVIATGKAETGEVEALKDGAKLVVNFLPILVNSSITGAIAAFQEVSRLQMIDQKVRRTLRDRGHVAKYHFYDILGHSPKTLAALEKAKRFGKVDATVLICGETGVGKEIFAHAMHNVSLRRDGPFIAVNCAAFPENLLESELFGYAEGAFTGAKKGGKPGLFELAHRGTIFLDEISEMSERLQTRLLRVLQEYEVMRLGDNRVIPVDVRVITATNCDLNRMVAENRFRADLFYRIDVLTLVIPPLRERKEDIPVLVDSFLKSFNRRFNKELQGLERGGMKLLLSYDWPGNARELRNILERLVILAEGDYIPVALIEECLAAASFRIGPEAAPVSRPGHPGAGPPGSLNERLSRALSETNWNRKQAAALLGISRSTLWRWLKKLSGPGPPVKLP